MSVQTRARALHRLTGGTFSSMIFIHSKLAPSMTWAMAWALQSFPVGSLDTASLFWGRMAGLRGLIRAELEKRSFSSQRPCRQGRIAKGHREKVGLRNIGQGDRADLSAPRNLPIIWLLASMPVEEGF